MEIYYAFFDVDGTLLRIKTLFHFLKFYFIKTNRFYIYGFLKYQLCFLKLISYYLIGKNRVYVNQRYYKIFKGKDYPQLMAIGEEWFVKCIKNQSKFWRNAVLREIYKHQSQGGEIVLISGSMLPCLLPLAKYLNIKYMLATQLSVNENILSGQIEDQPTIGTGKVSKINLFFETVNFFEPNKCYAYGDHTSDIPMLKLVGNPVIIAGNRKLERYAESYNWKILKE